MPTVKYAIKYDYDVPTYGPYWVATWGVDSPTSRERDRRLFDTRSEALRHLSGMDRLWTKRAKLVRIVRYRSDENRPPKKCSIGVDELSRLRDMERFAFMAHSALTVLEQQLTHLLEDPDREVPTVDRIRDGVRSFLCSSYKGVDDIAGIFLSDVELSAHRAGPIMPYDTALELFRSDMERRLKWLRDGVDD